MEKELIVVPNENIISDGIWRKELSKDDRHGKAVYEYALLHQLNLDFKSVDDNEETYNGFLWGTALAKLGHASLHIDDFLIIHVPNNITKGQYEFFLKHRSFIEGYNNKVSSCFISYNNGTFDVNLVIGDPDNGFPVSPVKLFYEELDKKYNKTNNVEEGLCK